MRHSLSAVGGTAPHTPTPRLRPGPGRATLRSARINHSISTLRWLNPPTRPSQALNRAARPVLPPVVPGASAGGKARRAGEPYQTSALSILRRGRQLMLQCRRVQQRPVLDDPTVAQAVVHVLPLLGPRLDSYVVAGGAAAAGWAVLLFASCVTLSSRGCPVTGPRRLGLRTFEPVRALARGDAGDLLASVSGIALATADFDQAARCLHLLRQGVAVRAEPAAGRARPRS